MNRLSTNGFPQNSSTNAATGGSALRRIGDDPILRPFLNSLFDPQAYVRTIIKDGKSDECLTAINDCTEKMNDEIQLFISKNKDSLMSGMQDISSLASRYHTLADHSKGLQTIVQRMKRETADSYNLIKARTSELDRIHEASTLLNHVKRFVKAKAQLDQYLKNPDDKDLRSLASAAKVVAELEKLLTIPNIQGIQLVHENINTIKNFGNNIRMLAQTKLLEAIAEKNQAAMAHYLQVFYNLESLPEILVFTVDQTVRLAAEASKDALQLDLLTTVYHDYTNKQSGSSGAGVPASATKRNASSTTLSSASTSTSAQQQPVTLSQLRIAMREITHTWSTIVFERATQMLILQRVVAKKEDPISHIKFRDILREKAQYATSNKDQGVKEDVSFLAQGQIVALFWQRLSIALHDICNEKLRHHPAEVVCRMYPYLRRAAQDVLGQMQSWTEDGLTQQSSLVASTSSMSTMAFLNDGDWTIDQLLSMNIPSSPFQQDIDVLESLWRQDGQVIGMFGSSIWHEDISNYRAQSTVTSASSLLSNASKRSGASSIQDVTIAASNNHPSQGYTNNGVSKEADLVQGLQPIRDRFLLAVLDRMQHPISQMFPDLDGYVAAIPSKRDLLTLIRAIQQEYVTVATESSDLSFVTLVNREFIKTVRLMLTKMESMIISNGADVRRIATTSGGSGGSAASSATTATAIGNSNTASPTFVRTTPQEHNAQCFVLLGQLREALQKLPVQIVQHLDDATTTAASATAGLSSNANDGKTPLKTPSMVPESARKTVDSSSSTITSTSTTNSMFVESVLHEITRATDQACAELDELASRHILEPILTLLTEYSLSILSQLHKESVITTPSQKNSQQQSKSKGQAPIDLTIENSLAIQALLRQLPALLKTYLFSLPKFVGSPILDIAGEELAGRILMLYISVASLTRPMTEAVRLRTTKDLSALEVMISQQFPHNSSSNKHCPVMREFRAFRRLLFEEQLFSSSNNTKNENKVSAVANVPNRARLFSLDYVQDFRPSTLLALLMAAGPAQLPLPSDLPAPQGKELTVYVSDLIQAFGTSSPVTQSYVGSTIRNVYLPSMHHTAAVATWTWKKIPMEKTAWDLIQHCLDVYFQRLTVAEIAEQKQEMRAWYEAIMDIGSHYFS